MRHALIICDLSSENRAYEFPALTIFPLQRRDFSWNVREVSFEVCFPGEKCFPCSGETFFPREIFPFPTGKFPVQQFPAGKFSLARRENFPVDIISRRDISRREIFPHGKVPFAEHLLARLSPTMFCLTIVDHRDPQMKLSCRTVEILKTHCSSRY